MAIFLSFIVKMAPNNGATLHFVHHLDLLCFSKPLLRNRKSPVSNRLGPDTLTYIHIYIYIYTHTYVLGCFRGAGGASVFFSVEIEGGGGGYLRRRVGVYMREIGAICQIGAFYSGKTEHSRGAQKGAIFGYFAPQKKIGTLEKTVFGRHALKT